MKTQPYSQLSPHEQGRVRLEVIQEIEKGRALSDVARIFQVSRTAVYAWVNQYKKLGQRGLESRQRGRPLGSGLRGDKSQELFRIITENCPDQLGLTSTLWTRDTVQSLIKQHIGVVVSRWTINRYLADWGLKSEVPLSRVLANKGDQVSQSSQSYDDNVTQWHNAHAVFYRLDVRPLRIANSLERWVYLADKERGDWAFMVCRHANTRATIDFLRRLLRLAGRQLLIAGLDCHVYQKPRLQQWLKANVHNIQLYTVPV